MTRLIPAVVAALLLFGLAVVQASGYDQRPAVVETSIDDRVAAETSCTTLRQRYQPIYNVWRGSVKKGQELLDQLHEMRAILARIGWLERHGWCGG